MALYQGRGAGSGKLYALCGVFLFLLLVGHFLTGTQERLKKERGDVAPSLLGKSYDHFDTIYGEPLAEKEFLYKEGLKDVLCKRFVNHGIDPFDSVYYAFWQENGTYLGACFTVDSSDVWSARTVLLLSQEQFLAGK